jgi:hypothetical protein
VYGEDFDTHESWACYISCEGAAISFYHELWHQYQPAGMGWPEPSEDDAYYNDQLWSKARGLPIRPELWSKDPVTGKLVPDKKKIRDFVQTEYPSPPPPVAGKAQPIPIGHDPKTNQTKVKDPSTGKTSWRPSKQGDTYGGPYIEVKGRDIKQSDWDCAKIGP